MTEARVGDIYDTLARFESRRRPSAYPVHKRLTLPEARGQDIYDWIARSSDIVEGSEILDAGCGVGYGSVRLAEVSGSKVLGISLSRNEVAFAQKTAAELEVGERLQFERRSFDEVSGRRFDLIVAVESLKHSENIPRTLKSLSGALNPGGQLVIVDDFYTGLSSDKRGQALARAWSLRKLHTVDDFATPLSDYRFEIENLTPYVTLRSGSLLRFRRLMLRAAAFVLPGYRSLVSIYGGGLELEELYRQERMQYLLLRFRKTSR